MVFKVREPDSNHIRQHNKRLVLRTIHERGSDSRAGLSKKLGLVPGTISNIVNELIQVGVLIEIGPADRPPGSRGGPRERMIELNENLAAVLAVSLGIYSHSVALVGPRGHLLAQESIVNYTVDTNPDEVLDRVVFMAEGLLRNCGLTPEKISGMGVAVEGNVDPVHGIRQHPYRDWHDQPIGRDLEDRIGTRVAIVSAVQAAALGEIWFGNGEETSDLILVKLGTTIGCAIVQEGQIKQGRHHRGDIGHLIRSDKGVACICGKSGCLETVVGEDSISARGRTAALNGSSAILLRLSGNAPDSIRASTVAQAAFEGDREAVHIVCDAAEALGAVLVPLVAILRPEALVVQGNLASTGETFLRSLERYLKSQVVFPDGWFPEVRESGLGNDSSILGAAAIALETFFY